LLRVSWEDPDSKAGANVGKIDIMNAVYNFSL
jgi:hypothetical protein